MDGGTAQNCGVLIPPWQVCAVLYCTVLYCTVLYCTVQGWHDWFCSINPEVEITCACEHPGQMYLQLRGLCPESRLDRFYVPRNMRWSGLPVMVGLRSRSRAVNEPFTVPGGGLTIDYIWPLPC